MRLSKIKLAGFKSFVDPTTITLPGNLMGIVGPNGCGKSNVIDAVRWVMGELSAQKLRGDSMADVIFNGSTARKPVGQASVELVFDNSDGKLGGQYAAYAEVSLKRVVARDGSSNYFLNGVRCRRRDITDMFLGTGLGSRSYSIIEQGMISRLIEARPEDLRMFLEEAAGISKYKERRRETESRIQHARENIARLNDLRGELEKNIEVLKRQARAAERYRELKVEEHQAKAELLALRWKALDTEVGQADGVIQQKELEVEARMADLRAVETRIEKERSGHSVSADALAEVQARFYAAGSEIARLEQAILHAKETRLRQEKDLTETEASARDLQGHIARDQAALDAAAAELAEIAPQIADATKSESDATHALSDAELRMQGWQAGWDSFVREESESIQKAQAERTRIEYLDQQLAQALTRAERLANEKAQLAPMAGQSPAELEAAAADAAKRRDAVESETATVASDLNKARTDEQRLADAVHETRRALATAQGRLSSLEALQQAALGKSREAVNAWLGQRGLGGLSRLAEKLEVAPGWERAVETVLGFHLEAVCVEQRDALGVDLAGLERGSVTLFESRGAGSGSSGESLAAKLKGVAGIEALVGDVFAVEDMAAARALRAKLRPGQSVVTRDGVWIGPNWVRVSREDDGRAGVLAREQEIKSLKHEDESLRSRLASNENELATTRDALRALEQRRDDLQARSNAAHREAAAASAKREAEQLRQEQVQGRIQAIGAELAELDAGRGRVETDLKLARGVLAQALDIAAGHAEKRVVLTSDRDALRAALDGAREQARSSRERAHALALKAESRRSVQGSLAANLERMRAQAEQAGQRREQLKLALDGSVAPLAQHDQELKAQLAVRQAIEQELGGARRKVEAADEAMRALDDERHAADQKVAEARDGVAALKLASTEQRVRRQTTRESLAEMQAEPEALLAALSVEANVADWEERVTALDGKIQRLGAVNLAAIEQFAQETERKAYLDMQHADLAEALDTLENAIKRIDRETRTRFKETFDRVNASLQQAFPRLFGGGHAYLEMTGEDLLDAGVTIMARPPGKRNSTIHLLSGGEKALTAIALVFALFELNPAPFCMLDEVDAPLDDVNAGRFCELVKVMSDRTQFVFITHNKITMELANQLTGVTMAEPGVSRLVSVDVDEAVRLAAM
jgi:chromosome segregation protein